PRKSWRSGRSPRSHNRDSRSAGPSAGSGRGAVSACRPVEPFIVTPVQAELLGDAVEGAGELHPPGLGGPAEPLGDLAPAQAVAAQLDQPEFVGAEPAAD